MLLDAETLDLAPRARGGARRRSAATRASSSSCRPRSSRSSPRRTRPWRRRPPSCAPRARDLAAAAGGRFRARRRRRASVRGAARAAQPRPALRGDRGASTRRRPPPARVRAARARRRPRRRPRARRLQRAALLPAASSPRWPRTRRSTRAATAAWRRCARGSPACCRARACRPRSTSFEAYAEALRWCGVRRPAPVVVGAAPAPRVRDGRGARARHADDGRGDGGDRRASSTRSSTRLAERPEPLLVTESWRIDQNRWSACRHGLDGEMTDLVTGDRRPTRELVGGRRASPATRQREVAAERGLRGLAAWLADGFLG